MPVYYGNKEVKEVYYGSTEIKSVYYGSTKVYSGKYPSGTVLFESSTPGTYTLSVEHNQTLSIILVGAGGKGAYYRRNTGWLLSAAGGGSGAYVHGSLNVSRGNYTIVVGSANGGNSSAFNNIARGGGNGVATGTGSSDVTGGSGGTYTVTSGITGENGNVGGTDRRGLQPSASGGASKYSGYGAGGSASVAASGGYANNGTNGYVKIVAV